jgi:hypothetical protein
MEEQKLFYSLSLSRNTTEHARRKATSAAKSLDLLSATKSHPRTRRQPCHEHGLVFVVHKGSLTLLAVGVGTTHLREGETEWARGGLITSFNILYTYISHVKKITSEIKKNYDGFKIAGKLVLVFGAAAKLQHPRPQPFAS